MIVCPGLPARTFPPPVPLCKSFPGPPRGIVFVLSRITFLILFFSVQKLMSALGVHRLQIIHLLSSYFRNFPFKRKLQFSFSHYFQRTRKKKFFFFFSVKGFLCLQRKFHEKTRERNFLSDLQRSEKLGNRRHAIPRNPSPRPAIHETNGRGNNGAVRRTSSLGDGS